MRIIQSIYFCTVVSYYIRLRIQKLSSICENSSTWYPKPTFIPTQLGLGITQAIHCEVIQVSTVYYAVCFPQTVYYSTWLTWDFRHLIVLMLLSPITRNHSTNNACCCVRLRMMTGPSIYDLGPVFERLVSLNIWATTNVL